MSSQEYVVTNYMAKSGLEGEFEPVEAGNIVNTYRVREGDDSYILQFDTESGLGLEIGQTILRELEETDVPVPEVEYFDSENNLLVTTSIGSDTLKDYESEELYYHAGELLAKVHDISVSDKHGPIRTENNDLTVEGTHDWRDAFKILYK